MPGMISLEAARTSQEWREDLTRDGLQEWLRVEAKLGYTAAATVSCIIIRIIVKLGYTAFTMVSTVAVMFTVWFWFRQIRTSMSDTNGLPVSGLCQ